MFSREPMRAPKNRRTAVKIGAAGLRAAFAAAALCIALSTLLSKTGPPWLFHTMDSPFHWVCHRIPERVLQFAGAAMPLCSRCAGIWLGLCLSAVLGHPALRLRTLQILTVGGAIFMGLEVLSQDLGIHPIFHPTRLLSGLLIAVPFGGTLGAALKLAAKDGRLRYPRAEPGPAPSAAPARAP